MYSSAQLWVGETIRPALVDSNDARNYVRTGLSISIADTSVAQVSGDNILAVNVGSTQVTITYEGQTFHFTLNVIEKQ
jgi:hypothetical protein